jgi:hypothetical protein
MHSIHPFLKPAIFVLALATLSGCWVPTQLTYREVSAKLDPNLTKLEREVLEKDIKRFLEVDVEIPSTSLAGQTFGGENLDAVAGFLNERIQYVLSSSTRVEDHVAMGRLKSLAVSMTGARNVGTSLFLESTILFLRSGAMLGFKNFEGVTEAVTSPRVGIMQLGELYKHPELIGNADASLERMGILIHEARHSDCTGGLSQGDLDLLQSGRLPINNSCGHSHVKCQSGSLAGLYACENHAWGAYYTGAMFDGAIAKTCIGCTEAEKQVGKISAFDSLSRIHPVVLKAMKDGILGAPDMSHSEVFSSR